MERYGFCIAALFMTVGGAWMAVWPKEAAIQNRDEKDDSRPPSHGEVWQMRIAGAVLAVSGVFFAYAILMRLPGADFLTP